MRWDGLDTGRATAANVGELPPPKAGAREGRAPASTRGGSMRFFNGRSLFTSLFAPSRSDEYLARYVLREHARGRPLDEVLDDPYVRNRSTPEQRVRLLERPEVIAALGETALSELRLSLASEA